jgi:hypothetical protein
MNIYTSIIPTRLYIKQHSITKKKYFGKTTRDPYKYNGSGEYWSKHIKKHGKRFVETIWISDLYYDTSISDYALHFSVENDIVNSKEWANQKPENGLDGGAMSKDSAAKLSTSWANKLEAEKHIIISKRISTRNAKSEEELLASNMLMKLSIASRTPEQEQTRKLKEKITKDSKSIEEKQASLQKQVDSYNSRTIEQKLETKIKKQHKRDNKSSQELKEIELKKKETRKKNGTGGKIPFLSMIHNKKTYDKGNLSKWYPEFKQFY